MDFQTAYNLGYYFDRCIDLEFYDSQMNFMSQLKTPKRGLKPSITVKGKLIEGSYAINSYISIQNMSYDINVNAVAYIKCRMYWSGIEDSDAQDEIKNGHTIVFSVLYADQEKEPPNRAVRFQCTTAAFDYTRSSQSIFLDIKKGEWNLEPLIYTDEPKQYESSGSKDTSVNFIDFLQEMAKAYNKYLEHEKNTSNAKKLNLSDNLLIKAIKYPSAVMNQQIELRVGKSSFGELFKSINNFCSLRTREGITYKCYVYAGVIYVETVPPHNWKAIMQERGIKESEIEKTYNEWYLDTERRVRYIDMSRYDKEQDQEDSARYNAIKLNFVKMAYRNEVVIHASTIFDDRIYPGCYCQISGNAIMGKNRASSKKSLGGSRIQNYTNEMVIFRVTGEVEYEFSTTEDCSMTLVGPVVQEWTQQPLIATTTNRGGV